MPKKIKISYKEKRQELTCLLTKELPQLIEAIKCKFNQNGMNGAVLGMSGGLDCTVVAYLLKKANINVYLYALPYKTSMENSFGMEHSQLVSDILNIPLEIIDITSIVEAERKMLIKEFDKYTNNIENECPMAFENLPAEIRSRILSTRAAAHKTLLMGTGNRTERETGYFTKRGDGLCDLNILGEYTKTEVRILASLLDIPEEIIQKAPSADLQEGQTDEQDIGLTISEMDSYLLGTTFMSEKAEQRITNIMKQRRSWSAHKLDTNNEVLQRPKISNGCN